MRRPDALRWTTVALGLLLGCANGSAPEAPVAGSAPPPPPPMRPIAVGADFDAVFAPPDHFEGSPLEEFGTRGLFPPRAPATSRVAVLDNGDASFAVRIQALRRAERSVRIQALVFTADEAGLYITELLKEKHRDGVDVRVIVDAFSNPDTQTQWMYFDLKQHGIEVEGYEALALQWLNEVPTPWLQPHAQSDQLDRRFHEKMWIIDGESDDAVAVVGGLNIANEYFRVTPEDPPRYWRDQDVVLTGAVVKDAVAAFDRNYAYFKAIKASRGFANTDAYWEKTRQFLATTGLVPMNHTVDEEIAQRVLEMAGVEPDLEFREARSRFFQNRPRFQETFIEQAYLKAIRAARSEVLISNAYFIASPALQEAVTAAARRCVRVLILTNSPETNDLPPLTIVGRDHYDEMLEVNEEPVVEACRKRDAVAGVQIWEWQGRRADQPEPVEGTNHGKWAVFDRKISLVGSHNLDPRSERLNSESAIVFDNETLSANLARTFYTRDLAMSRRISLEEARGFADPDDALYILERAFGRVFENEL